MNKTLGFLGWIYLISHHGGYFNLGGEIAYDGSERRLLEILDYWPQDQPLPTILYRKFTDMAPPPFRFGLVKRKRQISQGGWCVVLAYVETDLTRDLLNQPILQHLRYTLWILEDQDDIASLLERVGIQLKGHLGAIIQALALSDTLTRWLRGDVGWTAGPKPNITLHDFIVGFEPKWKRKPLTPEMLVK